MRTFKHHRLIKINLLTGIILVLMLSFSIQSYAHSKDKNTLLQMINEDRTTIDAIAGYDKETQRHILQVSQTPEALNKIQELQKRSKNQFRAIISNYDQDTQSKFYEMARYPNLINDLVRNGLPSISEINLIVLNYPEDIHAIAKNCAHKYYDVLVQIDRLNDEIDKAFQSYLEPYDFRTRESVNVLLAYPEIVTTLIEDMDFTAQLGNVYSEDPEWLEGQLDQISQELAEQGKQDLNAYKDQIQNDPEAYNEMLDASEKFAAENNEVRYESSSDPIIDVRVVNSYPYWFGYPYWYSDPYWRPRPIYYHTGFYRNNYGNVVFVGLPSFQFLHWQTYYHPTLFPHLSYNYYSYYENHYGNRYRDSHRPVPYHGFYRSIESNVINNPRVNNSNLERIGHQRGQDFVRRPNPENNGSARRGETGLIRRGETSTRQRSEMGGATNRQGNQAINNNENGRRGSGSMGGAINRGGDGRNNSGSTGGTENRRSYNAINPGRSEGPVNRRGAETGGGTIRREATPASSSPGGNAPERSRQGTSINRSNSERSQSSGTFSPQRSQQGNSINRSSDESQRSNNGTYTRTRAYTSPAANRQPAASENVERRAAPQSEAPRQNQETTAPAQTNRREASQEQRSSTPARREAPSAAARTSAPAVQREARSSNAQSSGRGAARERSSSSPARTSQESNEERGNRRER